MTRDHNSITEGERYFERNTIDTSIGVGILDISRDIPNHFVRKRCFDMTYWMVNQSVKLNLCKYRGASHNVKQLLQDSKDAGDEICVIAAQGLMAPKLYKIIHKTVQYYKDNPDFFVVGHIMAREDRYPGLHRQLLIVNLNTWEKLGSPEFLEHGIFWDRKQTYPNFTLSEETLSADYTPSWIKGTDGTREWSVVEDGANWIALACEHGITIDNFDNEMRECKAFLYPYEEPDKLERAWKNLQDEKLIDSIKNYTQRAWLRKIAYQEQIEKDRVYAYNTERLSGEGVRTSKPIDSIFSAAAGFKTMMLLENNGFHENTIVNYYDWCDASLKFKKHLLETWDGIDFHKWLLKYDLDYNFSSTYRGTYEKFWNQEIEKEFGTAEAFKKLWDKYSKLEHNFFVIDLVNEPEKLIKEINNQTGNKLLWTTNIWPTMMLHWNLDIDEIEQKYLNFEKLVPDDIVLYGQDYLANDLEIRIKKGYSETHPRFETAYKRL